MILCNCTFTRPTSSWFSSDRLSDFFNVFNSSLSKGFVYGIIPIYWLGVGVYAVAGGGNVEAADVRLMLGYLNIDV